MKDSTANPRLQAGTLALEGIWTVERAGQLRRILLDALRENNEVVLNLEGVTGADLSCIQLLCSAHLLSIRENKHLTIDYKQSEALKQVVDDAGYARILGCQTDPYKN